MPKLMAGQHHSSGWMPPDRGVPSRRRPFAIPNRPPSKRSKQASRIGDDEEREKRSSAPTAAGPNRTGCAKNHHRCLDGPSPPACPVSAIASGSNSPFQQSREQNTENSCC